MAHAHTAEFTCTHVHIYTRAVRMQRMHAHRIQSSSGSSLCNQLRDSTR